MQYKNPYIELCIEGASSIFRGLSQTDKEVLNQHHLVVNFGKRDTILSQGSKPKGLICLVSGKAKIFKIGAGNREQIIKMLRPLSFINYRSLFSDNYYPFSVVAIEESAIVIFEKQALSRLLKQNAELAVKFLKVVSEDLLFSNNRLVSLTQKHVRGRLAESLLLLRDTYGVEADGKTLRVMLSREDIAHFSNMTTSNAIRTLSGMVSEKILDIQGRKLMILNPQKLEAISESGQ
jgi:CRP/FNR family transcriptional regulator, polysaccharide utilization system transcription regulator